ncbi:MAG: CO dehydrogenase/acetyl-CoA synthase subunit delta [Nitrososphaerales archaeon]
MKEDKEKGMLKNLMELLDKYEELTLEGVSLSADELEINIKSSKALQGKIIREELGKTLLELGKALIKGGLAEAITPPTLTQIQSQIQQPLLPSKPLELKESDYKLPIKKYSGKIVEVTIGATKEEGGTRGKKVIVGGECMPAFHLFEGLQPYAPAIAGDVFDMPISLPKPVKECFGDALQDPVEWSKLLVEKVGVDLIDLELISTDPYIKDTPVSEAVKLVEKVLQTVKVPIIVGGSGNPDKDAQLLPKVAEVCEGERVVLSSATLDMWEPVALAAKKHNHVILAWTSIDLNQAKELNRKLLQYVPLNQILIDPTSAALGYGFEYAFTIMERIRLAAIMGDNELQCPQISGTANAWGAREAWIKDPRLGPREFRGPLWETIGALAYLLAGIDIFIMLHPAAIRTVKDVIGWLMGGKNPETFSQWLGVGG